MSFLSELLADSPILVWEVDETSGTTAADASGNARPGTYFTSPTLGQASLIPSNPASKSIAVSGGSSVFRSNETALNPTAMTLVVPFRITGSPGSNGYHTIGAKDSYTSSNGSRGWTGLVNAAGRLFFYGRRANGTFFDAQSADGVVASNTDYLLHVVYDGTTASIYLTGVLVGSHAPGGSSNLPANLFALQFGKESSGTGRSMTGRLDTAAFYGAALSPTRIAAHVNAWLGLSSGNMSVALPTPAVALTGTYIPRRQGSLSVDLPLPIVELVGTYVADQPAGLVDIQLPAPSVDLAGTYTPPPRTGSLTVDLPAPAVQIAGSYTAPATGDGTGTLDLELPLPEIQFTGSTDWAGTDPYSDDDDWDLGGDVSYDPPVVAPPADIAAALRTAEVYAQAFGPITMNGTEPVHTTSQVFGPAYRQRIVVDGVDISYFRDAPTPFVPYQRQEPFDYATATLTVPQVVPWAERAGVGDRSWMRPDAPVEIQLYDDVNEQVVATVWKGWVKSLDPAGDTYTLQFDGEVLGRATDDYRAQDIFRSKADIGLLMMRALRRLGARTASRYGPATKIIQYRVGGSKMIHYLLETMGIAQDKRGRQWTIMPDDQGRYEMFRKDTDTIHFTVHLTGDSGAYPYQLRRDLGVEVNQVYATGLTPEGVRILFGVYPGFQQMDPPPFPGTLSEGASGEQTTVLIRRLANFNYLTLDELPGGYDDDVVDAVKRLQRHAHLEPTGVVNPATWRALFDLDTTGRTLRNSRILPAAAMSYTEQYTLSATGAIIGFNPDWDPTRRRVGEMYDFGAGYRRSVLQDFAEAELDDGSPNWAGSVTIRSGAVIAGQHNPGDPLTEADLMHAALIKPGMNGWFIFGGEGLKARVAIVDVAKDAVTLRIDTRNRDAMKLSQVLARIRAAKENAGRSWWKDYKSGGTKEALAEVSEQGGYLDEGVDLEPGWNVIPLIAGDSGTIRSIEFDTFPPTETVVAVTGEAVVADVFERNIGDPSTEAGTARWSDPDVVRRLKQNHGILYQAGGYDEMGGYYPGAQNGTSSILTGEFVDEAGVPYYTRRLPVLYLVVWARNRARLRSGRIMYVNMEPV